VGRQQCANCISCACSPTMTSRTAPSMMPVSTNIFLCGSFRYATKVRTSTRGQAALRRGSVHHRVSAGNSGGNSTTSGPSRYNEVKPSKAIPNSSRCLDVFSSATPLIRSCLRSLFSDIQPVQYTLWKNQFITKRRTKIASRPVAAWT
jgi:hypothetical protein